MLTPKKQRETEDFIIVTVRYMATESQGRHKDGN